MKTQQIHIRTSRQLVDALDAKANKFSISRNELVNTILKDFINGGDTSSIETKLRFMEKKLNNTIIKIDVMTTMCDIAFDGLDLNDLDNYSKSDLLKRLEDIKSITILDK